MIIWLLSVSTVIPAGVPNGFARCSTGHGCDRLRILNKAPLNLLVRPQLL